MRVRAVRETGLLDSPPEPEFDELVEIAATICGASMGMFSLVDEDRLWIKAQLGIPVREVPREISMCHHTIQQSELFLVEDAECDARFADNPFVQGKNGIRFYAGMPVFDRDGEALGSFCVLDHTPRVLNEAQRGALRTLARQVQARIELRAQQRQLERALSQTEQARKQLAQSEQRFTTFMNSGPFLAYVKDCEGRMLFYNEPFARAFAVSSTEFLGKTDHELWPQELAESVRRSDLTALTRDEPLVSEERTFGADGSGRDWRSWRFQCADADGNSLLGGISFDVTAELQGQAELESAKAGLEAANKRLFELATVDALTGLANRRGFDDNLKVSFRKARRLGQSLCVLLIDVDNFKQHNDRFGHAHGDEVLRQLGLCFRKSLRAGDLPARYGGEEFTVLLPQTTEANALTLAERLLRAVRETDWGNAPVTISIGVSTLSPAMQDTHRLLTLADEALYAAKRAGKDRVIAYSAVYQAALAGATGDRS